MTTPITNPVLVKLYKEKSAYKNKKDLAFTKLMEVSFRESIGDCVTIISNCEYTAFYIKNDTRDMQCLTLNHYSSWGSHKIKEIGTSFYTTSDNSTFELRRMVLLGDVASVLLEKYDWLLEELNTLDGLYHEETQAISRAIYAIEKEEREAEIRKADKEKKDLIKGLYTEEGISFEPTKDKWDNNKYPVICVRYNDERKNIVNLKILKVTTSGKSATIQYTQEFQQYTTDDKMKLVRSTHTIDKVKLSNIHSAISQYKNLIVKTENLATASQAVEA